ncbi:MAG: hypothetical protein ABSG90_08950 [Dehalococcoidia bacterium]|jgi:hypothetical protein
MENVAVSSEQPLDLGNLQVIPLVKRSIISLDFDSTVTFHATKEPVFLIIDFGESRRAYRITGEEISFETLIAEYPAFRSDPVLQPVPEL